MSRDRITFILKLILGVVLLGALLLWRDTGREAVDVFLGLNWVYLIPLFALSFVMIWVSSMKWRLFVLGRGTNVSIWRLMRLYTVGVFFNNFMPSMVGGDLARSYILGRQIGSQSRSLASVFLERFTGVVALVALAFTFALINRALLREPIIAGSLLVVGASVVAFLVLLRWPAVLSVVPRPLASTSPLTTVASRFHRFRREILLAKGNTRLLAMAMFYSFLFHFLTSVNVYVASLTIGLRVSFLDVAVITPIILLVTMFPVSVNNLGWWEWAFSVFMVNVGAVEAEGLAVALILRAKSVIISAIGGIFFVMERVEREKPVELKGAAEPK